MKIRLALAALVFVLVASLGAVTTASAAPKAEPTAHVVGKVKLNKDGTATVKAHYICSGPGWHLWVSAKQAAGGSRNPAITQPEAGFGHVPAAWLQSHPTNFSCDGKWHTQKFQIDTEEQGYGELIRGDAWVQFCLLNEAAGLFLIDELWAKVR